MRGDQEWLKCLQEVRTAGSENARKGAGDGGERGPPVQQLNVFKAIESWRRHLELREFQEILHALVIGGAVGTSTGVINYGCHIKRLTVGYCSLTEEGMRCKPGAGIEVERPHGMPRAIVPKVRDPDRGCSVTRSAAETGQAPCRTGAARI